MSITLPVFQNGEYPRTPTSKSPTGPVLHIANARKEDSGTYICTASNGVGSMSADQIELRVLCKYRNLACLIACAVGLTVTAGKISCIHVYIIDVLRQLNYYCYYEEDDVIILFLI